MDLVLSIKELVIASCGVSSWGLCLVCDTPQAFEKPPFLGGYRPDIWVADIPHTFTIVGEAKTYADIDNAHTEQQLRAFLRYLAGAPRPELILAVPWAARACAIRVLETVVLETGFQGVQRVYLAGGTVLRLPR